MHRYFFSIIQREFAGILLSFLFVFAIIGLATLMQKKKLLSNEGSRKFIHILLCNWWILAMALFKSNIAASIGPLSFVVINYISYKKRLFGAMERGGGKEDLGTVYYALSLLILALVTFSPWSTPVIGAFGILIMGYGDGMAAVIGKKFGRKKIRILGGEKSLEGSLTMFIISFITAYVLYSFFGGASIFTKSMLIAFSAAVLEAFTPQGFDNLTVPIGTSFLYWLLTVLA